MYKCQICGKTSRPKTPAHKVVIQTRTVQYPFRPKVNACWKQNSDRSKFVRTDDPGGKGWECAREVIACPECAIKLKGETDSR